ncbi:hypothetical protein Tco_0677443 [Tanacetum coccineum]|uniref:Uncharacterized protein n=1 Tax=Tanacetum coccineum TaxID=301880 RepID=A0ABQ4XCD8_9ASTR
MECCDAVTKWVVTASCRVGDAVSRLCEHKSSRVLVQAYLVDTDTESDPEEAPSEIEECQPLVPRAPLTDEEFEASEPSYTRITTSRSLASSDSTAPLSPDHPLTQDSPTPTTTRVSFHRRTARMAVHTQPTLSPGMPTCIAEAAALSPSSLCKRYRSSYETSSSSSPPTLPIRKRYRGTLELVEDTEDESSDSGTKREEEKGAAPEGQQLAVSVVDTAVDEPLGLGSRALRRRKLVVGEGEMPNTFKVGQSFRSVQKHKGAERMSTFRQPILVTWIDLEDGRVYTDILTYVPPTAPVQTLPSPK